MKRKTIIQYLREVLAEYPPEGPTCRLFDAGYVCALRFALELLEEQDEPADGGKA